MAANVDEVEVCHSGDALLFRQAGAELSGLTEDVHTKWLGGLEFVTVQDSSSTSALTMS